METAAAVATMAAAGVETAAEEKEAGEEEEEEVGEGSQQAEVHLAIETEPQWPRLQTQTPESEQNELTTTTPWDKHQHKRLKANSFWGGEILNANADSCSPVSRRALAYGFENAPTSSIFSPVQLSKPGTQESHLSPRTRRDSGAIARNRSTLFLRTPKLRVPGLQLGKEGKRKETPWIRRLETGGLGFGTAGGAIQERCPREASNGTA